MKLFSRRTVTGQTAPYATSMPFAPPRRSHSKDASLPIVSLRPTRVTKSGRQRVLGLHCAIFILLLAALIASPGIHDAYAQSVRKTEFSRELPGVASVLAFAEDLDGFLWIGTSHGLFRYDGYEFVRFKHIPEDTTSISSDAVSSLLITRDGTLWAGTLATGINRLDRATGSFMRYAPDPDDVTTVARGQVLSMLEDRAGHIWVATRFGDGLSRLDPVRGSFTRFVPDSSDESSIRSRFVWTVAESKDGTVWVSTGDPDDPASHALERFDPETNGFTHFVHDPTDPNSILPGAVSSFVEDSQGRFWVTTIGGGLNLLDRERGTFRRYPYSSLGPDGHLHRNLFLIKEMRSGELLLSGFGRGVCRFEPADGSCTRLDRSSSSLVPEDVIDMYEDRSGVLWLGRLNVGLQRIDRNVQTFDYLPLEEADHVDARRRSVEALSVLEDSRGTFWMGTRDGIYRRERNGRWQEIAAESGDVEFVITISEDARGNIWFGFHGDGAARLDPSTNRLTRYRHDPTDSTTLAHDSVDRILGDKEGRLWFLTHGGFGRWSPESNHFVNDLPEGQIGTRIQDSGVIAAAVDGKGQIWVGLTAGGLAVRDADGSLDYVAHGPGQVDRLRNADVRSIVPDDDGVWIGTCGGGIYRMDLGGTQRSHYSTLNTGLQTDCIQGILVEHADRLWLNSNQGIIRFEPSTGIATQYSERDGLQSLFAMDGSSARGANGTFYFGSILGVHSFVPQPQGPDPGPPQVLLTRVRVGNAPEGPASGRRAALASLNGSELRLSHEERDVTFDYLALHFTDPSQNRYSYRLDGHDPDWIEAGAHRQARYTNLKPGRYTFRVKAVGAAGAWNEDGATMSIIVQPPWWRTIWAYGLYGLMLIGGVFATDRIQRKRLVRRERERARERELAQAREIERAYNELRTAKDRLVQQEKLASLGALTAGIAHEIKNPLNFVNNFASLSAEIVSDIESESAQNPSRPIAEIREDLYDLKLNVLKIEEHGKRADAIVRSMLDHSRGQAGEQRPVAVNALVEEYANLAYHGMRAQDASFNVTIERNLDPTAGEVTVVPQDIGRVLINLINNAFHAVHARSRRADAGFAPTVRIETHRYEERVEIRVWDNGGGIPSNIQERIFEPFFTTKSPGEGTGLGLSLSYEIVTQGHRGRLDVDTEPGEWTQFRIELPAERATNGHAHKLAASRDTTGEAV